MVTVRAMAAADVDCTATRKGGSANSCFEGRKEAVAASVRQFSYSE